MNRYAKFICILASLAIVCSGCQSGFLKRPDLGKLAFWKGNNLNLASRDDLPPPSKHFSPDGSGSSGTMEPNDSLKKSIDQMIAEAKENKSKDTEPIRKPYSLDSIDPVISNNQMQQVNTDKKNNSDNDFALNRQIDQIQSTANKTIDTTRNAIDKSRQFVANAENSFDGWQNNIKKTGQQTIANATNEFQAQTNNVIKSAAGTLNQISDAANSAVDRTLTGLTGTVARSDQPSNSPYLRSSSNSGNGQFVKNPAKGSASMGSNDFVSTSSGSSLGKTNMNFDTNSTAGNSRSVSGSVQQSSYQADQPNITELLQPSNNNRVPNYPKTAFGTIKPLTQPVENNESRDDANPKIEIPASLLKADSSFSPGSTRSTIR